MAVRVRAPYQSNPARTPPYTAPLVPCSAVPREEQARVRPHPEPFRKHHARATRRAHRGGRRLEPRVRIVSRPGKHGAPRSAGVVHHPDRARHERLDARGGERVRELTQHVGRGACQRAGNGNRGAERGAGRHGEVGQVAPVRQARHLHADRHLPAEPERRAAAESHPLAEVALVVDLRSCSRANRTPSRRRDPPPTEPPAGCPAASAGISTTPASAAANVR